MLTLPVVIESDPERSYVVDLVIEMLAIGARMAESQSSGVADTTAAPAFHPINA